MSPPAKSWLGCLSLTRQPCCADVKPPYDSPFPHLMSKPVGYRRRVPPATVPQAVPRLGPDMDRAWMICRCSPSCPEVGDTHSFVSVTDRHARICAAMRWPCKAQACRMAPLSSPWHHTHTHNPLLERWAGRGCHPCPTRSAPPHPPPPPPPPPPPSASTRRAAHTQAGSPPSPASPPPLRCRQRVWGPTPRPAVGAGPPPHPGQA